MQESESRIIDKQITNINTTQERFFLEYLITRKPIIDSIVRKISNGKHLRNKPPQLYDMPMKVLAQLLYYNNLYRHMPDEDRWRKVFDYDTKLLIMEKLNISEDNLNSYFSQLRKIRILDGKTINNFFVIYPKSNEFEITFKFKIGEESNG